MCYSICENQRRWWGEFTRNFLHATSAHNCRSPLLHWSIVCKVVIPQSSELHRHNHKPHPQRIHLQKFFSKAYSPNSHIKYLFWLKSIDATKWIQVLILLQMRWGQSTLWTYFGFAFLSISFKVLFVSSEMHAVQVMSRFARQFPVRRWNEFVNISRFELPKNADKLLSRLEGNLQVHS